MSVHYGNRAKAPQSYTIAWANLPHVLFINVQVSVRLCSIVSLWVYLLKRRIVVSGMEVELAVRAMVFH